MKREIISAIILLVFSTGINEAVAQAKESSGQQYVNLMYSMSINSAYITGGYERIIVDNIGLKGDITYEKGKINLMEENNVLANIGVKYTVLKLKNISYTSVGAGICAGEESIKNNEMGPKKMSLCYGASITINSDFFVAKRVSLGLSLRQYYFQKSIVGKFNYMAGLNLRYRL